MHSLRRLALALLLPLAAAACQSPAYQLVPMPDQSVDLERKTHGRVYIIREDQTIWQRIPITVYNADQELGSLGPGTWLCWERDPGRVLARLIFERDRVEGGPIEQLYDAQIEAGEVRWVRIHFDQLEMKVVPERMTEEAGRALVAEYDAAVER